MFFSQPLYVMLKPASSQCNLACRYCYYQKPFPHDAAMSDELLELFTQQYIESQMQYEVLFTWHGGEPLLRPLSFYMKALALQQRYACGHHIDNCLQTNGTLLTDEWCLFLRENHFLVGISIDGPQDLHDAYRLDRGANPSWKAVMRGIRLLQKHGVEWNAMATVNRLNADYPVEFYRFFKDIGCEFLQFTPVVERAGGQVTDYSVTPCQWGHFLCRLFDEWVREDVGRVYVQTFDATLANWVGVPPSVCSLSSMCGHAAVMEYNGDVYSCDHFVFPEHLLGNIRRQTLIEMIYGDRQKAFGQMKSHALPRQCRECPFLFTCHGECPKNRFMTDRYGEAGLNYLCEGYRKFFDHVAHDMDLMKAELEKQD